MAVSFPWPTREMAGAEVLPIRSMRPEEKSKWLQQLWSMLTAEKNREGKVKDRARSRSRSPGAPARSNARFEAPRPTGKARPKSLLVPGPSFERSSSRSPQPPGPPQALVVTAPAAQLETLSLNAAFPDSSSLGSGSLRRSNATSGSRLWQGSPASSGAGGVSPVTPSDYRARRYSHTPSLTVPAGPEGNHPAGDSDGNAGYNYYQPGPGDGDGYLSSGDETSRWARPRSPGLGVSPTRGYGADVGLTRLLSVKRPNDSVLSDAMALALFRVDED